MSKKRSEAMKKHWASLTPEQRRMRGVNYSKAYWNAPYRWPKNPKKSHLLELIEETVRCWWWKTTPEALCAKLELHIQDAINEGKILASP